MIWFTSDMHIGHKNICEHSKRPFISLEEMNHALVNMFNSHVHPNDDVYMLGDFSFYNKHDTIDWASKLNGNIRLVTGNHDRRLVKRNSFPKWEILDPIHNLKIDDKLVVLSHFPIKHWENQHRGSWHLHGHTHIRSGRRFTGLNSYDVGVDNNGYAPVNWDLLKAMFENQDTEIMEIIMDNETYQRSMAQSNALALLARSKEEREANRPQLELHVDDSVYERLWTGQRIRHTTKERWALEAASARLTNELLAPYREARKVAEARAERRRTARRVKSNIRRMKGKSLREHRGGMTERQVNALGLTDQELFEARKAEQEAMQSVY